MVSVSGRGPHSIGLPQLGLYDLPFVTTTGPLTSLSVVRGVEFFELDGQHGLYEVLWLYSRQRKVAHQLQVSNGEVIQQKHARIGVDTHIVPHPVDHESSVEPI